MQKINEYNEAAFCNGFRAAVKLRPEVLDEMDVKVNPFPFNATKFMDSGYAEFNDGYGYTISIEYERCGKTIKIYSSLDDFDAQFSYDYKKGENDGALFAEELGRHTYECICNLMSEIESQGGFEYEEDETPNDLHDDVSEADAKDNKLEDINADDFIKGLKSVDVEKLKWKYDFRRLSSFIDIPMLIQNKRIKFVSKAGDKIEIKIKMKYVDEGVEYDVSAYRNLKCGYETGYLSESSCKNKEDFYRTLSKTIGKCVGSSLLEA